MTRLLEMELDVRDKELEDIEAKLAAKLTKADKALEAKIRAKQEALGSGEPWDWDNSASLQRAIDNGSVWHMEGYAGRTAMQALEKGECFLPLKGYQDYYGNTVPPRTVLKPGTKGTLENSARFWGIEVKQVKKARKAKRGNG